MSSFTRQLISTATVVSENSVLSVLKRLERGTLTLHTPTDTYTFPNTCVGDKKSSNGLCSELSATIRVHNPNFFFRLVLSGDLGFAESYMYGEIDIDSEDLVQVFLIFIRNKEALSNLSSSPLTKILELPTRVLSRALSPFARLAGLTASGFANVLASARGNISAHYDLGNDMFEGFLSKDMTYSCAIFPSLDSDLSPPSPALLPRSTLVDGQEELDTGTSTPTMIGSDDGNNKDADDELYDAQIIKLQHIIRKADIRPGHRVLEIGSGWGALSLMITQTIPGTVVDTLTLSNQQADYVNARVQERDANLEDRLHVHLMDYRSMPPEWKGTFDRVVSVEMVEAVGIEYLETYFATIDWALKKTNGVAVVQGITIPEGRFEEYVKREDFIRKWVIFPGGILPTVSGLTNAITKGSKGRLVVDSISNIGPHYARTLREWRRRFEAGFGEGNVIEEALKKEHPEMMNGPNGKEAVEVFRRKWVYYFTYCEAGFTTRILGDHIITFCREGNQEYGCQVFA